MMEVLQCHNRVIFSRRLPFVQIDCPERNTIFNSIQRCGLPSLLAKSRIDIDALEEKIVDSGFAKPAPHVDLRITGSGTDTQERARLRRVGVTQSPQVGTETF